VNREPIQVFLRPAGSLYRLRTASPLHDLPMADFLVVVGIVAFVAFFLGLIWALERV
jgi:hypothetical protein